MRKGSLKKCVKKIILKDDKKRHCLTKEFGGFRLQG